MLAYYYILRDFAWNNKKEFLAFAFLHIKNIFRGIRFLLCSLICYLLNFLKFRVNCDKWIENREIEFIVEHVLDKTGFEFGGNLVQILIVYRVFPFKRVRQIVSEPCGWGWLNSIFLKVLGYYFFVLFSLHAASLLVADCPVHNWKHICINNHGKGKTETSVCNLSLVERGQIAVRTPRKSNDCIVKRVSVLPRYG